MITWLRDLALSTTARRARHQQLQQLLATYPAKPTVPQQDVKAAPECIISEASPELPAASLLMYAGVPWSLQRLVVLCVLSATVATALAFPFLPWFLSPLVALVAGFAPVLWLDRRATTRAFNFSSSFPSVLLAAASSMKAGFTPVHALQRGSQLLCKSDPVRLEIDRMLLALQSGISRDHAVREFANTIRQPDLDLFRAAFLLTLEHGGRFSSTLQRLAAVTTDRLNLMQAARVSTTNMRMTANVLLLLSPLIVAAVALRTDDFLKVITTHPTANTLAGIGLLLILGGYGTLRRMSNLKL